MLDTAAFHTTLLVGGDFGLKGRVQLAAEKPQAIHRVETVQMSTLYAERLISRKLTNASMLTEAAAIASGDASE